MKAGWNFIFRSDISLSIQIQDGVVLYKPQKP